MIEKISVGNRVKNLRHVLKKRSQVTWVMSCVQRLVCPSVRALRGFLLLGSLLCSDMDLHQATQIWRFLVLTHRFQKTAALVIMRVRCFCIRAALCISSFFRVIQATVIVESGSIKPDSLTLLKSMRHPKFIYLIWYYKSSSSDYIDR